LEDDSEKYRLTKEILDSIRDIDGFPIGEDEDIIALSDPPYYTACPNPFIKDFIKKYGKPYDPDNDDYHKEPFTADIQEGKSDTIYKAHSYHTQSPYKAILKYILHYTSPGDIIYDGFCGTGMAGFAAQICGTKDVKLKKQIISEMGEVKWGFRKAVLCDLSTLATFLSYNYNKKMSYKDLKKQIDKIIHELEKECRWVYITYHNYKNNIKYTYDLFKERKKILGEINYVVWSDRFLCPNCSYEFSYWDVVVDHKTMEIKKNFNCPNCDIVLKRNDLIRTYESHIDQNINKVLKTHKQVPVLIFYRVKGKKGTLVKEPDDYDLEVLSKINTMKISTWFPINKFRKGLKTQEPLNLKILYIHQVYTKRNLYVLSTLYKLIKKYGSSILLAGFLSSLPRASKRNRYIPKYGNRHVGTLSNALYFPPLIEENNLIRAIKYRFNKILNIYREHTEILKDNVIITTQSSTDIRQIPNESIDYIFTDPPFGSNIMYSELNFIRESWIKVLTNNKMEALINSVQNKKLLEYQNIMELCFKENFRILKPNRWITVEFHNTSNKVWTAIQEALMRAGFIVADVRTLDKKKGTINQLSYSSGTVRQDLIISAYKPSKQLEKSISINLSNKEQVWNFIYEHLTKLPVYEEKNGVIEIILERQNYLLFDRMVAFFVQRGIAVPMSASEFYAGLKERFPQRDGMYFLIDQVAEYDKKRMKSKRLEQVSFTVQDEKTAILWLNMELRNQPQTYQEIQPKFLQNLHKAKHEDLPELRDILEQNFIKDDEERWHVPDPSKDKDLEKLRLRALLSEFRDYLVTKGKLKIFRSEAVRAGFNECWQQGDYESIIKVAEKLPTEVLQEDPTLLMYYDNALMRKQD